MNAEEREEIRARLATALDTKGIPATWWRSFDDAILVLDALDELSERVKRAVGLANEYLEDEESLVREDPFTVGTCQVASELLAILTGDGE